MDLSLNRFKSAHSRSYASALHQIKQGQYQGFWSWYIFPAIKGTGSSPIARFYEIQDTIEARAYWNDALLSSHLVEICRELMKLGMPIESCMDPANRKRLQSCMTLFLIISGLDVFKEVLNQYFNGEQDAFTTKMLREKDDYYPQLFKYAHS